MMIYKKFRDALDPEYAALITLLDELDIDVPLLEGKEVARTEVKDGRITISIADNLAGLAGIILHELGHIVAATEDEFLLPNLGLPSTEGIAPALTERIQEAELIAIAFQATILETEFGFNRREKLLNLAAGIFKLKREDLYSAVESGKYSLNALIKGIKQKQELTRLAEFS